MTTTTRFFARVQALSAALACLLAATQAQATGLSDNDLSSGLGTLFRWLLPFWF